MRWFNFVIFACFVIPGSAGAQTTFTDTENNFKLVRAAFRSDLAFETTAFAEQRWRLAGNTGFNETIQYIEKQLKAAGFVADSTAETKKVLTYRIEKRPMQHQTWEPLDATIRIEGINEPVLTFSTNRNMIAINSVSTPDTGIRAELIYVGKGAAADLEGKDLKGKILFGEASAGSLYQAAARGGAAGILAYSLPAYVQPEKNVNSIQFGALPESNQHIWGILLSHQAKERLKSAVQKGRVYVNVFVKTKQYQSEELTILANVRGTTKPDERFVFSAHVQEPGANDNASGVGTLTEMARVTAQLVTSGVLTPKRTLTFLWGDEIVSTQRYINDDTARAKGIKWGMSLDMVGEDTRKTGGTFLIEKMPDPSAIWTRGADKHTEWGASNIKEKDLFPHYFNDFVFNRCKEQGQYAGWAVNYNPFEGGSDHTPFLQAKIPGLLMWHFTDVYYHTDGDRLDKVSKETLKNVGITALAVAYTLTSAGNNTALNILNEVFVAAKARLQTEFDLSKMALTKGKSIADEKHILEEWYKWYNAALATTGDIPCDDHTNGTGQEILKKRKELEQVYQSLNVQLK